MMAYIFSSLALVVSVISFFVLFFYVRKRTTIDRIPAETREQVVLILDELGKKTVEHLDLIEDGSERLHKITDKIDKKISVYTNEMLKIKESEETVKRIKQENLDSKESAYRALKKHAAPQFSNQEPYKEPQIEASPEAPPPAAAEQRSLKEQMVLMSASGLSNSDIASKLHTTITEVEMALALHSL